MRQPPASGALYGRRKLPPAVRRGDAAREAEIAELRLRLEVLQRLELPALTGRRIHDLERRLAGLRMARRADWRRCARCGYEWLTAGDMGGRVRCPGCRCDVLLCPRGGL